MLDFQKLRNLALARIGGEPGLETGLAVGGVPFMELPDGILIAVHCKTPQAPKTVMLARAEGCEMHPEMATCVRPSPFQLKRGDTRRSYFGKAVNTLTATDGKQDGPRFVCPYDPETTTPIELNDDEKEGKRTEELVFFPVKSLRRARSVFDDGYCARIKITSKGAYVGRKKIPDVYLVAWERGDDSQPPDPRANLPLPNGKIFHPSTPGAYLISLLREYFRS